MLSRAQLFAIAITAILVFFFYSIKSVLPPFIYSVLLAYFFNPIANYLVRKFKISRIVAVVSIMLFLIGMIAGVIFILVPIMITQLIALVNSIPEYYEQLRSKFLPFAIEKIESWKLFGEDSFSNYANEFFAGDYFSNSLHNLSKVILEKLLGSSLLLINLFSLLFIIPVLTFYLLKDWNLITKNIAKLLPANLVNEGKIILTRIDNVLLGYVKGQINVCLLLGIFYSISLTIIGLNSGFVIGFVTGIFAFVPYVGMAVGVLISLIVALFQWGFDPFYLILISLIFITGQLLEANFFTPKLIGSQVGLHPLWIIFGFFVFGKIFGFVGLLMAVPFTAISAVIIKYIIEKASTSKYIP